MFSMISLFRFCLPEFIARFSYGLYFHENGSGYVYESGIVHGVLRTGNQYRLPQFMRNVQHGDICPSQLCVCRAEVCV